MRRKLHLSALSVFAGTAFLSIGALAPQAKAGIIYTISSGAVPLSNLVGTGNSVQVGDKVFSNFTYVTAGTDMPTAADVNITPEILTIGSSTFEGIGVTGAFMDTNTPGISSATLGYSVQVTDPSVEQITTAALMGDPAVIGTGQAVVTDTLGGVAGSPQLVVKDIEPGNQTVPYSSVTFAPVASLTVTKAIVASVPDGVAGNWATVTSIDQLYAQTPVPEPASLGVLALGALGLIARRRR